MKYIYASLFILFQSTEAVGVVFGQVLAGPVFVRLPTDYDE